MEQTLTQQFPDLVRRGNASAKNAIGQKFRVRTGKNVVTEGIITECKVDRIARSGRSSVKCVYAVTMECGINKVSRTFYVDAIPR
jgi:hypothetical protein